MNYTRFVNDISMLPEHHGKFLVHCLDPKSFKNEELRLYRFADFMKYVNKDLNEYEKFSLLPDNLYTFQLFIHTPEHEKYMNDIKQHSTTMSVMYKIIGGTNYLSKLNDGEKIYVHIYDNTSLTPNKKHNTHLNNIILYDSSKNIFEFDDNEIVRVLEKNDSEYHLKIVKSNHIPWFNFSTNSIIPTDRWKIPQSITSSTHHSLSYIINNKLYYKFPDDKSNQHISFNVYFHDNMIYHKCITSIDESLKIEHYNSKCCVSNYSTNSKNIVEDINMIPRTINHCFLSQELENKKDPKLKELQKICNIHKTRRLNFMKQPKVVKLIKYIENI